MKDINALALADYILGKYPDKNITPMKLQKLAYYSKAWTLVADKNMVTAEFMKWDFGPVNWEIFQKYKKYSKTVIPHEAEFLSTLTPEQDELLTFILDNYADLSAFALSAMTHCEEPWVVTTKNTVISDKLIVDYYSQQPFAKNFSSDSIKTGQFHLIKSDNWHSFTLDMSPDEAGYFESYSSYEEYLKHINKAEAESKNFLNEVFN